jgi:hypothetical protein
MSLQITLKKTGSRNVRFNLENTAPAVFVTGRDENVKKAVEPRPNIALKRNRSMVTYRARNIAKKHGISMADALEQAQRESQNANKGCKKNRSEVSPSAEKKPKTKVRKTRPKKKKSNYRSGKSPDEWGPQGLPSDGTLRRAKR